MNTFIHSKFLNILLLLALVFLGLSSILIGSTSIELNKIMQALFQSEVTIERLIVWEIRIPRSLGAILVGALLGFSGAVLQVLFKNPLAEPAILGISSCASLGAVLALYFGLVGYSYFALPLMAVLFTLLGIILLFVILRSDYSTDKIILSGMLMNGLMAALMALVLNFAPSPFALHEIMHWLMGSVANLSWSEVTYLIWVIIPVMFLIATQSNFLDAQVLGEQTAKSMGFEPQKYYPWILILLSIAMGTSVAFTGVLGFVGLVVPNLVRPMVGYKASASLLPSALLGAILLLVSDMLVRLIPSTVEIKLAVMTALLGTPFLFWYLYRYYRARPN